MELLFEYADGFKTIAIYCNCFVFGCTIRVGAYKKYLWVF